MLGTETVRSCMATLRPQPDHAAGGGRLEQRGAGLVGGGEEHAVAEGDRARTASHWSSSGSNGKIASEVVVMPLSKYSSIMAVESKAVATILE